MMVLFLRSSESSFAMDAVCQSSMTGEVSTTPSLHSAIEVAALIFRYIHALTTSCLPIVPALHMIRPLRPSKHICP
jgi:hypothetical protein